MLVSVLIPLHNGAGFLPRCLGSVYRQTHRDLEILIGVNGHPEGSPVHLAALAAASTDPRASVLCFPGWANKPMTVNAMAASCSGDVACVLDVDDWWASWKLSVQLPFANSRDVIGTAAIYGGAKRGEIPVSSGDLDPAWMMETNHVVSSSAMLKPGALRLDPSETAVDDYELWMRLAADGATFYNHPRHSIVHHVHAGSAFNTLPGEVVSARVAHWRSVYGDAISKRVF